MIAWESSSGKLRLLYLRAMSPRCAAAFFFLKRVHEPLAVPNPNVFAAYLSLQYHFFSPASPPYTPSRSRLLPFHTSLLSLADHVTPSLSCRTAPRRLLDLCLRRRPRPTMARAHTKSHTRWLLKAVRSHPSIFSKTQVRSAKSGRRPSASWWKMLTQGHMPDHIPLNLTQLSLSPPCFLASHHLPLSNSL